MKITTPFRDFSQGDAESNGLIRPSHLYKWPILRALKDAIFVFFLVPVGLAGVVLSVGAALISISELEWGWRFFVVLTLVVGIVVKYKTVAGYLVIFYWPFELYRSFWWRPRLIIASFIFHACPKLAGIVRIVLSAIAVVTLAVAIWALRKINVIPEEVLGLIKKLRFFVAGNARDVFDEIGRAHV